MDPNDITYFGETDARNKKIRFGIKAKDRLKHVYVIGKTGMGKSTLLENMAIQDIQNGNGIAFIDPHGGTAEKLLDYVPEHRVKDVLYFAPFDLEYPVSFNIMEDIGPEKRHLVANGLMSAFKKLFGEESFSDRMQYILQNTILALLEYPGATMLGVNKMLSEKEYRNKVIANITDPSVKAYWTKEYAGYTERFAAEAIPAIQNKIGQFTSNPLVRNIIGQEKSSFIFRDIMDQKKILIVNLSKGRVGEGNANLLGSMLITKIYLAAMSRADASEKEMVKLPNFYLYVDEFQSFANQSFADILSEARKYKLNLTIAHQYIEQMEEEVRNAVFGNVGTMITFRVGALDAELLEKEFAPVFTAEDLVNLGIYQMYLKLMIDGVSSTPFSAKGMMPIERPEIMFRNEVVDMSRKQFARSRLDVEKNIADWHLGGNVNTPQPAPAQNPSIPVRPKAQSMPTGPILPPSIAQNFQKPIVALTPTPQLQTAPEPQAPVQTVAQQQDQRPDQVIEMRPTFPTSSASVEMGSTPVVRPETAPLIKQISPAIPQTQLQPPKQYIDQNKSAFLKASEELHAKIYNKEHLSPEKREMMSASLSTLTSREAKKEPSLENISSLKNALSQVVAKSTGERKPLPNTFTGAHKESTQAPIAPQNPAAPSEPKPIERTQTSVPNPTHTQYRTPEPVVPPSPKPRESYPEVQISRKEVPEETLRKILQMDEQ